ncbi:DNA ligase ATP-dependent N-terminal [Penicillium paradoxum]|uniref:DNA ligase ATP-dependent N-terminal n=1 Tax=Penicillium paradoxum TaxID=176176 RepID=UPI0025484AF2|nr:DNA ligase ATP-dependent N-terminal [Penicillium paradoxum]KAJ5795274.1 DNA ligase ATP-dependent N-terminal [Penicillium paradoxum]
MGFQFAFVGDLLSSLDDNRTAKASTASRNDSINTVAQWFSRHEGAIHHAQTDRVALLSCIFPEKRTDRVYSLQATKLSRVIGRCLGLGSSRVSELNQWQNPGGSDLGGCVENVMRQAENYIPAGQEISIEEIDRAMALLASRCRHSGPKIRRDRTAVNVEDIISKLYRRLSSRDAKWLTRMILKSYSPVVVPESYTLKKVHFLLPQLLQLQNSFEGALGMLASDPISQFPPNPDAKTAKRLSDIARHHLRPRPGVKVGRPDYYKARSIKHCLQMINGRRMSIERKYDGEYCQIHIDLSNKFTPIQIFSKSGKDSTADRDKILPVVEKCLRIGLPDCKISHRCILEGELLVWNDDDGELMDFNKLRRLIPRSGTLLGVESDSPPQPYEHLMIMFFDILLLDDELCLAKAHRLRRLRLQEVVMTIHGRADLAEQEVVDFGRVDSYRRLEISFEKAIARRWEGYVLKASDEPYFPIYCSGVDYMFGRWIKLKKDYIPGLGDTVDLALIGGTYNSKDAPSLGHIKKLKWTHFLIGCLTNKEEVKENNALPHFRVVDVVGRFGMSIQNMQMLNHHGEFYAREPDNYEGFHLEYGCESLPIATALFKHPFIVEMLGSGFEKPSGARYFTLRFPRILKIHSDRTLEDAASLRELHLLAEEARAVPTDELEEREKWSQRLMAGNGLNQFVKHSPSPEATCSDTDNETDSPSIQAPKFSQAAISSGNGVMETLPLMEGLLAESTGDDKHDGLHNDHPDPPMLYIDETILPTEAQDSFLENSVLADNENLSSRRKSSQKDEKAAPQESEESIAAVCFDMPPQPVYYDLPRPIQRTTLVSAHRVYSQELQDPQTSLWGKLVAPIRVRQKRKISPQSPITTIPIWTPETSLGSFTLASVDDGPNKAPENHDLHNFIHCICSDAAASSLQHSNPYAASQGTRFGIVLFDPKASQLGEEMLRIATALSSVVHAGANVIPATGKIFFLGSTILDRNLSPGDLRFCLRDTWQDVGCVDSYSCLSWDLNMRSDNRINERENTRSDFDQLCSYRANEAFEQKSSGLMPPWIQMTFEETDVAVLGEYISIEPLAHILDI